MEARANHGAHMRSKSGAPSCVVDDQVHLPAKQLVLILSVMLLLLINSIKPHVEVGEIIIHVLVEVGSIKAQGARPSVAPDQRGSMPKL